MNDALSAVLSLLKARATISGRLRAGGHWSILLPPPEDPKFNAVLEGGCWLHSQVLQAPVELREGDSFLLVDRKPYVLSSDPQLAPTMAGPVFRAAEDGIATIGNGQSTFLIGGQIELDPISGPVLLAQLPPLLILRAEADSSADLRWALQAMVRELASDAPGQSLLSDHLAQVILILILRGCSLSGAARTAGWLSGLADPRISRAIGAVHGDPGRNWTVRDLAREAGMSRSSFAEHFTRIVGCAPMAYTSDWRLLLATSRLTSENIPIGSIASDSGYGSESAFGVAFKRRFGTSPARFRRQGRVERTQGSAGEPQM